MNRPLVVVVDGARARFYRLERRPTASNGRRHALIEIEDLINPAQRARDADLFSDVRPGLRTAYAGGPAHGVDDHRDAHTGEFERRFAAEIMDAIARAAPPGAELRVILAAGPDMLGLLRRERDRVGPDVELIEYPKQLTRVAPHELQERLASDGII